MTNDDYEALARSAEEAKVRIARAWSRLLHWAPPERGGAPDAQRQAMAAADTALELERYVGHVMSYIQQAPGQHPHLDELRRTLETSQATAHKIINSYQVIATAMQWQYEIDYLGMSVGEIFPDNNSQVERNGDRDAMQQQYAALEQLRQTASELNGRVVELKTRLDQNGMEPIPGKFDYHVNNMVYVLDEQIRTITSRLSELGAAIESQ